MKRIVFLLAGIILLAGFSVAKKKKYEVVEIKTSKGTAYIWLYKDTPKHSQNFLKLAKKGFFDSTTFHRVINTFMIQGGDPYSRIPSKKDSIGEGGPGYEIPAEIKHMHKRGVIAAARNGDEVNPDQQSSGSQFYIVHGKKCTDADLANAEARINEWSKNNIFYHKLYEPANKKLKEKYMRAMMTRKTDSLMAVYAVFSKEVDSIFNARPKYKFTPEQREIYKTMGGTPMLDGHYTAFGEVLSGMEMVDAIATVKTTGRPLDRPLTPVTMDVNVVKFSKKEFMDKFGTDPDKLP
jgi:peptidylprolyl isomerase